MARRTKIDKATETVVRKDAQLVDAASQHGDKPALRALAVVGEIGDQEEMRTLCALVIGGGLVAGNARVLRSGLRMLLAHEVATFVKDMVKVRVNRTRPRSARTQSQRKPRRGESKAKELSSFPSGHSAGAIAAARAFAREFPEFQVPAIAAAGAVAAVQLPSRAHYASDVAAGLAIGVAAEAAVNAAWELAESAIADPGGHD